MIYIAEYIPEIDIPDEIRFEVCVFLYMILFISILIFLSFIIEDLKNVLQKLNIEDLKNVLQKLKKNDSLEKVSSDLDISERDLKDEIEELADGVRKVFWEWNNSDKIPREEVEIAKENALKLTTAIEKLLAMID